MTRNKHAASRIRPKIGNLATKIRRFRLVIQAGKQQVAAELALFRLKEGSNQETERKSVLMKTADMMVDSVRTHKNPFRSADQRITKVQQSRYERRKIRAFLRLGEYLAEA